VRSDIPIAPPLRAEIFSAERMERHGPALAASHALLAQRARDRLLARLSDNQQALLGVGARLKSALDANQRLAPAAEWLLDNFYLVEEQVRTARRHLPKAYSRELPRLASGPSAGLPRAYAIAAEAVAHGDGHVEPDGLRRFVAAYQTVAALQIGELWAIPIMLRLALIENLRRVAGHIVAGTVARDHARSWADRMMEVAGRDPKSLILVTADMARSDPPMTSSFVAELARRLQGQGTALAMPLTWIEERLAESGTAIEQVVQSETQEQAADQVSMSNSIGSLRLLGAMDWREFVEAMSVVERELRAEPVYGTMEFATRDQYRHVVERLARASTRGEAHVAREAVRLAAEARLRGPGDSAEEERRSHVGFYLLDAGLPDLERALRIRTTAGMALARIGRRFALPLYVGAIALIALGIGGWLASRARDGGAGEALTVAIGFLAALAASHLAVALVNRAAASLAAPRPLPRLDFSAGIPAGSRTLAVVPAMLASPAVVDSLAEALEVRFLGNRDANLCFALLTDYRDAPHAKLPEDADLVRLARDRVEALNRKYACETFFLFHRPRRWNPSERCWMGYERKRGKQAELNAFLRGGSTEAFEVVVGDPRLLADVRYVITLDADTQLPRGAARQLAGAMAHPLNRPVFDERPQRIIAGYGILQPRIAVSLPGIHRSRYARLCAAEPGIDPYTRAVSDVYQDVFGEGSFIGKGIYDVDAFESCLKGRFPDDQVLSHDLLEGCYVRSGLLSDVQLYEEYPARYRADASRRYRWIRGDWQIAPWLRARVPSGEGTRRRNPLSLLSQWKIFDNLRRSLVPPAALLLFLAGWTLLATPWLWTSALLAIHFVPPVLAALVRLAHKPAEAPVRRHLAAAMRAFARDLAGTAFALACLPFEALYSAGAIGRTLVRMLVTRTRLLEWTTSSALEVARTKGEGGVFAASWRAMWIGPAIAAAAAACLAIARPESLAAATPVLVLWFASPALAWWLDRPRESREPALRASERDFLRSVARRTWGFFDRFAGPADHWLVPDNYQLEPVAALAHRTSPTNVGLSLLAALSACDFGYISVGCLLERVANTLATLRRLERHHGHFYNWYDTRSLAPLLPLYVSSVDSGNLAAHLLTLRAGLLALCDAPILPPRLRSGLRDTADLANHAQLRATLDASASTSPGHEAQALREAVRLARAHPRSAAKGTQVEWAEALALQCEDMLSELEHFAGAANGATLRELAALPGECGLRAGARILEIERLARESGSLAEMRYDFLYDDARKLLSIGYDVSEHRRDASFYDLLASEARATTFVAIAQGELPQESWFALGRVLTGAGGEPTLLSWSGSMFEYLMPLLVMPSYEDTLLDQTCRAAVRRQIAYGKERGVPWGMSESGYFSVDVALNYRYRAFGVPGLGLKRGLGDDLVVAPYASALALMVAPRAACANLQRLAASDLQGAFGFHEAIDYTAGRLPRGQSSAIVRSFMAHHQAMVLLSIGAALHERPMQRRFASDPLVQATLLLLQEQVPKPTALYSHTVGSFEARVRAVASEMPMRVLAGPDTPMPEVQLLSNGRYHVMVTNAGGGFTRWKDLAVTRWREDATRDHWGAFCYLRDLDTGAFWSNAHQPTLARGEGYEAIFSEARVEFRRTDHEIETHTEIVVSPEDDIDLRRVRVTNRSRRPREIEVTSYAEVVLAPPADDAQHPAFSNLFVSTEVLDGGRAIVCTRRPRSAEEPVPWMFHLMTVHGVEAGPASCETDRGRFIGRGGTLAAPRVMREPGPLSASQGSVLDPIVAVRRRISLAPDQSATVDMVTGMGDSRGACVALAGKYLDRNLADRVFEFAWTHNRVTLRQINASESDAQLYASLAGRVLFAHPSLRAAPAVLLQNRRGQSGLWGYAISGDLPIVLVQIADASNIELVRQMVQAHAYWRLKGLAVDLVIWNEDRAGYRQLLQEQILGLIAAGVEAHVVDRPGGIFVRRAEQIAEEDRTLFQSVARIIVSDRHGTLVEQVNRPIPEPRGAHMIPAGFTGARSTAVEPLPTPGPLLLSNDHGGFSADGTEYVVTCAPREARMTPAPWANVVANAAFGTLVSESGAAYTWSENAHEFRLTPWSNDAVTDASGEALYIRDEESGEFWSPTPLPCPGAAPYVIRHGFGYSVFEHAHDGIGSELRVYVDARASVKFSVLTLSNRSGRPRRLSVTGYVEWVLGDLREKTAMHVVTEIDKATGTLCARNAFNTEMAGRTAFFDADSDEAARTVTGDRTEFLGRNGSTANPAALSRPQLSNRVGAGLDPCAAIQVAFGLADGREREIVYRLGVAAVRTAAAAGEVATRLRGPDAAREALETARNYWRHALGAVQVETGDAAIDVMANGWLPYQALACRMWARTGHYQSGGAFGFRDQLQDAMALVHAAPALLREHLLRCAGRQFTEGDVQHWWHPPSGRGVRTHCSDDFLWLPLAACRYVVCTGDMAVLDEPVGFLEAPAVAPESDSYYDLPGRSGETATLYRHCVLAIEHGLRFGVHGLPLIGSGDWNDGMNKVGAGGKGESVWLAFFLHHVLERFAAIASARGDAPFAGRCRSEAVRLAASIEKHGWDGEWYRRAYFDDGTPLGSASNVECRIDSISQSWSVLSGAAGETRARQAMLSLDRHLVRRDYGLVQLLDPPFDKTTANPGYIKGYLPGVRENGGQYTHAAVWAAMAFARIGQGARAWELLSMINPANHAATPAESARYKVEPYVVAADVYAVAPHIGRGGWTWYTGAAGWMYRLILESLLGVRREGERLHIEPCLAPEHTGFRLRYRHGRSMYRIEVVRDAAQGSRTRLSVDGVEQRDHTAIRLVDDGREHAVELRLAA
jgi:cellobiose phosphorylase